MVDNTLLKNALEALEDGFIIFDDQDRLVMCNSNYRKIYAPYSENWKPGTHLETIVRDTVREGIGAESEEEADRLVRERLEIYRAASGSSEQHLKNGCWIRVSESRLPNNWTVGTRTDITQLKRVEAELQISEAQFRDFAETAADYFWEMGPDLRITHAGGRFEEISGVSPQQVMGMTRDDMRDIGWAHYVEETNPVPVTQAHEAFANAEVHWTRPDGGIRILTISGKPFFDDDGNFLGYRGSGRDITEHKRAQEDRELLIKELELKNTELERFDYTISHELKSPLVTISGFTGMLLEDARAGNSERMDEYAQYISSAVDTMSALLNDLLELSRIGRIINPPENVDLGELASEISNSITSFALGRDIEIEIAADLPEVYVDRLRMREVLQNLIGNSIKFCDGQATTRIKVGLREQGPDNVIFIQDNGAGIDQAYHEKVFGLFERLDSKVEGTGIGLTLVQRILHEHGSRVWVESEGPGKGSTFCFTLPRTVA